MIDKYRADTQKHCSQCGKETYSYCTECNAPVHGNIKMEGAVVVGNRSYTIPYYCYDCGTPYPWTKKVLDNAVELVSLDDELDETAKELIKNAIPELLVETPTTPVAIAKYQKGVSKAGQIVKDALQQLLVDVVSETVKKTLFS